MRCTGCGGKVGARVLTEALARLEIPTDGKTVQGLDRPDDAALLNRHTAPIEVTFTSTSIGVSTFT